jgi:hypothetical protein
MRTNDEFLIKSGSTAWDSKTDGTIISGKVIASGFDIDVVISGKVIDIGVDFINDTSNPGSALELVDFNPSNFNKVA